MRIFHVSDCYAPRTGGIESQVRDLARAQAAAGHDVHVLTATPGAQGERGGVVEQDGGVSVHRLGAHIPFDLPVNPAAPARMRALLRENAPDVVHVHAGVLSPFAFDGARVALAERAPLAITWHCMLDGTVPLLRAAVGRTGWGSAPVALSAVSRPAADRVAAVFGTQVDVVPNGMDLEQWGPVGRDRGDATGLRDVVAHGGAGTRPGVVTAGVPGPRLAVDGPVATPLRCVATMRLAPRKRGRALVDVVEDAMTQLEPGSLTLDVIGDGPMRSTLARRIERRGLGDVIRLRGRLPRDQVRAAYDHADVFLAPATLEAFGIAALEARTAGLVVLARQGTGIESFVTHGVDGLLVDDDACMARWLVRLATDPGRLAVLLDEARTRRPVFDWEHTLDAAQSQYERAATMRRGA